MRHVALIGLGLSACAPSVAPAPPAAPEPVPIVAIAPEPPPPDVDPVEPEAPEDVMDTDQLTTVLEGFGPKVDGFDYVEVGDLAKVEALIGDKTAGILIEPVQGEGGIIPIADEFLQGLRKLCDKHGILLGFDEVQSGMGRTGKLLACEWSGVKPDVVSLGKGIAGGFPVGACLATAEAAKGMVAGTHGSTYGGNPLAMAAGNAVLDVLLGDGFLEGVQSIGAQMMESLEAMRRRNDSVIDEVRGKGLFIGVKTKVTNMDVVNAARAKGLITVPAADNVVRLLPPLTIDGTVADEALAILEDVCRDLGQ